uniref:Polysaccharide biosynthesis enzyme WcbI domain-containing protein n=1 Tax=viral metagenome TaxID=1070528 RepID=A0A6C0HZ42_9ZZZZ
MYISVNDIMSINNNENICICDRKSDKNILLIGSCRITPFLNYIANDNYFDSYNILAVMVHNTQMKKISETLIENEAIKKDIYKTTIFIHEFCRNSDYFNIPKDKEKNIYQIKPIFDIDISLPNYQDPCIFTKDIIFYRNSIEFDKYIKNEMIFDEFSKILQDLQHAEKTKYYNVILKSELPELLEFVKNNIDNNRMAHTINHPSNFLFIKMYELILQKWFHREIPESVFNFNKKYEYLSSDGYSTKLTYYDKECLNYNINEEYLNEQDSNTYILEQLSKKL